MRYKRRNSYVDAVRFVYGQESVDEIREFCGDAFISYGMDRHPDAEPYIIIKYWPLDQGYDELTMVKERVTLGDWVLKDSNGNLKVLTNSVFVDTFERVD